jgi:hypothetical protein
LADTNDKGDTKMETINPFSPTENVISLIDAEFVVRRNRALIRGTDTSFVLPTTATANPGGCGGTQLNCPNKGPHFYRADTQEKVKSATVVEIHTDGTVWAWGVNEGDHFAKT